MLITDVLIFFISISNYTDRHQSSFSKHNNSQLPPKKRHYDGSNGSATTAEKKYSSTRNTGYKYEAKSYEQISRTVNMFLQNCRESRHVDHGYSSN